MKAINSLATIQAVLITKVQMKIEKTIMETMLVALNLMRKPYLKRVRK